jgi:hypothetical protein
MSERDSNPSSDNTGNQAPKPDKKIDNAGETTQQYFIPVVVLIVLSIIVVSTFYSKEFNHLIAGAAHHDQAGGFASEVAENSRTSSKVLVEPEAKVQSNPNAEAASVTEVPQEAATAEIETTVHDSGLTTADTSPSDTAAIQTSTPESNSLVSINGELSYPATNSHDPLPYAPPTNYGMPRQRQAYNEKMEQWRRSPEEAMRARREHMMKIHEYRAAVLKRIEQDRLDMYKRMRDIEQVQQKRLDERMNWMEQQHRHSLKRPI